MRNLLLHHQVNPELGALTHTHTHTPPPFFLFWMGMKMKDEVVHHIYMSALSFISSCIHIQNWLTQQTTPSNTHRPTRLLPFNKSQNINAGLSLWWWVAACSCLHPFLCTLKKWPPKLRPASPAHRDPVSLRMAGLGAGLELRTFTHTLLCKATCQHVLAPCLAGLRQASSLALTWAQRFPDKLKEMGSLTVWVNDIIIKCFGQSVEKEKKS